MGYGWVLGGLLGNGRVDRDAELGEKLARERIAVVDVIGAPEKHNVNVHIEVLDLVVALTVRQRHFDPLEQRALRQATVLNHLFRDLDRKKKKKKKKQMMMMMMMMMIMMTMRNKNEERGEGGRGEEQKN